MEKVEIKTIDGVTLSGLLWDRGAQKSALLLHAMPKTKESFEPLAEDLYSEGVNVLAIDFRGHGESGGGDYTKFTPEDHQKYFMDARAALNFLEEKYSSTNFVIAGASIGANIALQCMDHDHTIKRGVALSAGIDYYGVKAIDFVQELDPTQSVLFAASKDDNRNSSAAEQLEELYKATSAKKEKMVFQTGGHGTDIWESQPELLDRVCEFLAE